MILTFTECLFSQKLVFSWLFLHQVLFLFLLVVLGMEARASQTLGKSSRVISLGLVRLRFKLCFIFCAQLFHKQPCFQRLCPTPLGLLHLRFTQGLVWVACDIIVQFSRSLWCCFEADECLSSLEVSLGFMLCSHKIKSCLLKLSLCSRCVLFRGPKDGISQSLSSFAVYSSSESRVDGVGNSAL